MIKSKRQMFLVIGTFVLVMLLGGVTYAFFNYTRTGDTNTLRTGQINFSTTESTINLSNAFPIKRSANGTDTTNTADVVITITGNTTYSGGIEYLVSATAVENTINNKTIPISIAVSGSNLGTDVEEYFDNRGEGTAVYKVLAEDTVENNEQLLVGYIPSGVSGVNGSVTIRAFLDKDLVAISDTLEGGPIVETGYVNGTTSEWVNGRVVLTTSEWNSLQSTPVTFKVKVEAQEGTWVEEILQYTDESCFTTQTISGNFAITGYDVSCGGTDVVIPKTINGNDVLEINYGAFMDKGLTSAIIPEGIETIANGAFTGNPLLTKITIPGTIKLIEGSAFSGSNLVSVYFKKGNVSGQAIIRNGAFMDGKIENLHLSNTIKELGASAFINNKIKELIIPDSVEIIDNSFGYNEIENLIIGENVKQILFNAFIHNKISEVTIPSSVETMHCSVFMSQKNEIITQINYENSNLTCTS